MTTSTATVPTADPGRYVRRLCTHFAHKVEAEHADGHGRIAFEGGICTLDAEADALVLRIEADGPERLHRLEDVVERHLLQFAAGREDLAVDWS